MPRHEQKLTVQSPLSLLVKPGAVRQDTLPGLPAPRDTSRLSIPRIGFILRRGVENVKSFRDRFGTRWHTLNTEQKEAGFRSSLSWSEGDNKRVVVTAELTGDVKMTQEGGNIVLTSETGATIKYHHTGASLASPVPLRRQVEQTAQIETPWYLKTAEAVGRLGIRLENIEAEIVTAPAAPGITKNDKPVARFKLKILGVADEVILDADAYNDRNRERGGNPYRVQQTINKKLQAGDTVLLTGHYHYDKTTFQNEKGVKPYERRWLRLIVIDRKATG